MAEPLAREAAVTAVAEELAALKQSGGDIGDGKTRRGVERRVFIKARQAAVDKFNEWEHHSEKADRIRQDQEGRDFTARDMGARITREELARALGEPMPDLAQSLKLKQFADPRPENDKPSLPAGYEGGDDDDDDDDDDEPAAPAKAKTGYDDDDGPGLELEGNDDDGPGLELEGNDGDGPGLELEGNDGDGLPDGMGLELEENDGDELELELEENEGENKGTVI
jgi:hypothetical protein